MNPSLKLKSFAAAFLVAICLPVALWSQVVTGTITGTVQDSTGAVIPGVRITILKQRGPAAVRRSVIYRRVACMITTRIRKGR